LKVTDIDLDAAMIDRARSNAARSFRVTADRPSWSATSPQVVMARLTGSSARMQ